MKEPEKSEKMSHHRLNTPNGSRDIPFQSQEFEQNQMLLFCRFLASFSLKYDVTDTIL